MDHLSEGAIATWDIPYAASHLINDDIWLFPVSCLLTPNKILQRIIAAVDNGKEAVCLSLAAEEHAIEPQPLGTCQRRGLHVFCALDDGDAYLLETAIAATVLERGEEESVGSLVDDLLHHRTHALTDIHDASCFHLLLNPRNLDIFQISHTRDAVFLAQ